MGGWQWPREDQTNIPTLNVLKIYNKIYNNLMGTKSTFTQETESGIKSEKKIIMFIKSFD